LYWDDPALNIDWPLMDDEAPLLSEKDRAGARLGDADLYTYAPNG
jgi:dTDP-4-dehydrorhamnose 3,5-epimerase